MNYKVKSKTSLMDLTDLLRKENIELVSSTEEYIEVNIQNEKEFELLCRAISLFLVHKGLEEDVVNKLIKKGYFEEFVENLLYEESENIRKLIYFVNLTEPLVAVYFKKINTLNIDSFLLFNMKGFKEELEQLVKKLDKALSNKKSEQSDNDEQGIQEILGVLRKRMVDSGLELENFRELHIFQERESLIYKNKDGICLDNNFLLETMGSFLEFELKEPVEGMDLLEDILLCSAFIQIFDVNKVVIHESVAKESKDALMFHLNSYKKEMNKRMKVVMCNGCKICR